MLLGWYPGWHCRSAYGVCSRLTWHITDAGLHAQLHLPYRKNNRKQKFDAECHMKVLQQSHRRIQATEHFQRPGHSWPDLVLKPGAWNLHHALSVHLITRSVHIRSNRSRKSRGCSPTYRSTGIQYFSASGSAMRSVFQGCRYRR